MQFCRRRNCAIHNIMCIGSLYHLMQNLRGAIFIKLDGLAFCGYRLLHIRYTHICMWGGKQGGLGTEHRPAGWVFIAFRCRGQSKVGEERHEQRSGSPGPARQNSPASLSHAPLFTQESLSNTTIIKGWPVLCLLHTSSLQIYGTSLLDPPPQTI